MTENTKVTTEDGVAYADMPWQKLKALMTAENQEWVNAEHAIEYLNAQDAADDIDESSEDAAEAAPEEAGTETAETENDQDPEADPEEEDPGAGEESTDEVVGADDLVSEPEDDIPVFDPKGSKGEIFGSSKVRYHQGGHYFNGKGEYVPDDEVND